MLGGELLLGAVFLALFSSCTAAACGRGDADESCGSAVISMSRSSVVCSRSLDSLQRVLLESITAKSKPNRTEDSLKRRRYCSGRASDSGGHQAQTQQRLSLSEF